MVTNVISTQDDGYAMSVSGESQETNILKLDAHGNVEWAEDLLNLDINGRIWQDGSGNYVVYGKKISEMDGRIVKLDSSGDYLWQKTYGDENTWEHFEDITVGYNSNYIVVGEYEGDFLVMEIDSSDGSIEWQKSYGGDYQDIAFSVTKVQDENYDYYLVVGTTISFLDTSYNDIWAIRIDEDGNLIDQYSYGGNDFDRPYQVINTSDGGWIISGLTHSYGTGAGDIWLIKFDQDNTIDWQKTYGAQILTDNGYHIVEFLDSGGYLVAGSSYNFWYEYYYIWLMKIDQYGSVTYDECGTVIASGASQYETEGTEGEPELTAASTYESIIDRTPIVTVPTWSIEACSPFD